MLRPSSDHNKLSSDRAAFDRTRVAVFLTAACCVQKDLPPPSVLILALSDRCVLQSLLDPPSREFRPDQSCTHRPQERDGLAGSIGLLLPPVAHGVPRPHQRCPATSRGCPTPPSSTNSGGAPLRCGTSVNIRASRSDARMWQNGGNKRTLSSHVKSLTCTPQSHNHRFTGAGAQCLQLRHAPRSSPRI